MGCHEHVESWACVLVSGGFESNWYTSIPSALFRPYKAFGMRSNHLTSFVTNLPGVRGAPLLLEELLLVAVAGIGSRFDELRKELGRASWRPS